MRMVGVVRDINERRRAQEALEANQLHFRRLFDEAPHVICLLDAEGKIRENNETARELLGYAPEELYGLQALNLVPESDRETGRRNMERRALHVANQARRGDSDGSQRYPGDPRWQADWSARGAARLARQVSGEGGGLLLGDFRCAWLD